jgi:hypothetical protein
MFFVIYFLNKNINKYLKNTHKNIKTIFTFYVILEHFFQTKNKKHLSKYVKKHTMLYDKYLFSFLDNQHSSILNVPLIFDLYIT